MGDKMKMNNKPIKKSTKYTPGFSNKQEDRNFDSKPLNRTHKFKNQYNKKEAPNPFFDAEPVLKSIVETWNVEAKHEPFELFYNLEEVKLLESGKKNYVIGRKGMGKTAIVEYIYNIKKPNVFCERLTFKNFPFNLLYSLENNIYTSPNQYITIWKYLIYNAICKMMSKNQNMNKEISCALIKMYTPEPIKALSKLVPKWTASGFGMEILGCGANIEGLNSNIMDLSWIEKVDILEEIIEKYADDSFYYILIDELDEDYRDFENEQQRKTYTFLLTSLFKAVQDIVAYFKDSNSKIRPIVFLRSDIYSFIKDSDKNKWSANKLDLIWTPDHLYDMLCHRISTSSSGSLTKYDCWKKIFSQNTIFMGHQGRNKMGCFDYITRSTHWRPRDYIHYISECAKLSLKKNEKMISDQTVKEVDKEFSEYLKGEIIDEIFAVVPNIDEVFSTLSQIRKQTFPSKAFIDAYCALGNTTENGKLILLQLFEHGIIGNQPSMKGQQIFKYQYPNALFNYNENIIIHRGLYKALQIF